MYLVHHDSHGIFAAANLTPYHRRFAPPIVANILCCGNSRGPPSKGSKLQKVNSERVGARGRPLATSPHVFVLETSQGSDRTGSATNHGCRRPKTCVGGHRCFFSSAGARNFFGPRPLEYSKPHSVEIIIAFVPTQREDFGCFKDRDSG